MTFHLYECWNGVELFVFQKSIIAFSIVKIHDLNKWNLNYKIKISVKYKLFLQKKKNKTIFLPFEDIQKLCTYQFFFLKPNLSSVNLLSGKGEY